MSCASSCSCAADDMRALPSLAAPPLQHGHDLAALWLDQTDQLARDEVVEAVHLRRDRFGIGRMRAQLDLRRFITVDWQPTFDLATRAGLGLGADFGNLVFLVEGTLPFSH